MKRVAPSERLTKAFYKSISSTGDPLGEAARLGAQLMLQKGIEEEINLFLGRQRYERGGGRTPGFRNGYEAKTLHTAEGSFELQVPQLRDTLEPFESQWLRSIDRRSKRLRELIPILYVKGMSQRDIESALIEALDVEQTGRTVIMEVCKSLRADYERWQDRDLSSHEIAYLFLDGIYLKLRPEDKKGIAVLCAYGIRHDGKKVLLHLAIGDRESTACWEAFLEDMKQRELADPLLVVIDGNSGCKKAVKTKFAGALIQRCQVHKMRNIINKLPRAARPTLKKLIQKAFTAKSYKAGLRQARALVADFKERFPAAMKCLAQDLEETLTALRLPVAHQQRVRTTNLLERLFGEARRRSKIIPRFPSEASGMALIFAVLVDASEGWRGVRMTDEHREIIQLMTENHDAEWEDPDLKDLAA